MDFQKRAAKMGIDVTTPHRVMILLFKEYQELSDTFEGQRLLEQMEASIRHEAERQKILYLREPSRQICILPWCATAHMTAAEKISHQIRRCTIWHGSFTITCSKEGGQICHKPHKATMK